jgi:hypothetical protein
VGAGSAGGFAEASADHLGRVQIVRCGLGIEPGARRRMMVYVWYPTDVVITTGSTWLFEEKTG